MMTKQYDTITKITLRWLTLSQRMVLVLVFMISLSQTIFPLTIVYAADTAGDPMTGKEKEAIVGWPNWVANACSATGSAPSAGASITGETTAPAKAVQQVVWDTLTSGGIDAMHTAAVMGNIAHEGAWDPTNIEDPAGQTKDRDVIQGLAGQTQGYGLIGWTPGNSLLGQMQELGLGSHQPYTAETQAAVILGQIQGKVSVYDSSVGRQFLSTTTIEDATSFYEGGAGYGFERPGDPAATQAARIASAKQFLREFGGSTPAAPASPSAATPGDICCPPAAGSATPGTVAPGEDPETTIWNYLVGQMRLSSIQAAGVMGNIKQESGFSPTAVNPSSSAYGIIQWIPGSRLSGLEALASREGKPKSDISVQLAFMQSELEGTYKTAVLNPIKASNDLEEVTRIWLEHFEIPCSPPGSSACNSEMSIRLPNAQDILQKYGDSVVPDAGQGSCGSVAPTGDADLKKTITVDTPGKFIKLPSRYSCPGHETMIDSRIAADVAYLATTYNLCANDGLASGHLSHGAGVAVDMVPKDGDSKQDWQNSAEAAAKAIGWWGDSATDSPGTVNSCADYGAGDYGQCMHEVYPDKFPQWMRWMGYNGAYIHGDPWHVYPGGAGPHIHIGWDTPNHDGTSSSIISQPRQSVYAFPAPVPPDLQGLIN